MELCGSCFDILGLDGVFECNQLENDPEEFNGISSVDTISFSVLKEALPDNYANVN